ncbi:MAG TPA: hypothetical protein VGJ06_14565 [Candidatus Acidoferrum sp.]|jgi:hypothetical protein
MRHLTAIALLFFAKSAFASPATPDLCSLTSEVKDAKVTVSLPDGKTSFREGEIIPLTLSFTSTATNRYSADNRNYDRSGRLTLETYCVEPSARDPLADYFATGSFMGGGLGNTAQLSEKPFTASAELNEWRQPAPGHYRLYVVSHRVWRPPDPHETTPYGRVSPTLRSNTVEFEIVKADAASQQKQLLDAVAAFQSTAEDERRKAARKLRFLNTKSSVDALAKLFWALNDQSGGWDLMFGIFGSPYRAESIAAMQREIRNPTHPITQDFLSSLTRLQINSDPAWNPPANDPAHPEISEQYWKKRQTHDRELMQAAIASTSAALPQKTGRARTLTVLALAESSDFLDAPTASRIRKLLVAAWDDLPENTQQELIRDNSPLIAGPEMLPILKEFVAKPAPPSRSLDSLARDAALQHIYDLNADAGRLLILRDLRDPAAQPAISLVKLLSADDLRPVIKDAVARVEKNDARELDYHLVELYGDASALAGIKTVFNDHLGQWACEQQTAMLRYFLRLDPEFGAKAAQASLAARKETGCYRFQLQEFGDALPKVEPLAIATLNDSDLEVANDAAIALGHWGTPAAEPALWERLKLFHQEWHAREDELRESPPYTGPIWLATALEQTLVNSIATGTSWICGPEKFAQLTALASPRQKIQIAEWSKLWAPGSALILPNWYPEDQLSFAVLQYSALDEQQFKSKLSQFPRGTKLLFQMYKPEQIAPPVTIEKQESVFEDLRNHASQSGVTIEKQIDP